TDFLIDPTGFGNVAAEYDGQGNMLARYLSAGQSLVSRVDPGGVAAYFDFDAVGSTVDLTDPAGASLNRYSYLPFGELLSSTESIANPYTYVGQFGVSQEGSGLDFMRARF